MVRGERICGLLVDPGAASGLIGTGTLKELLDAGMVPKNHHNEISWGASTTTVTGISGQSVTAPLLESVFPLQCPMDKLEKFLEATQQI